ncbi:MAG TPA: heme-binding protein [Bryobacteraceae bacterium]|jgi:hypothetical protein
MPSTKTDNGTETPATATLNPLDAIPEDMPFDVPYGPPISLERAQAVIHAALAEAKKRNWKMNVAVADSGGNLVAFARMDGAMLASIQIAMHKARASSGPKHLRNTPRRILKGSPQPTCEATST